MRTFKINDRLEFPLLLNMKPYTKEGVSELDRSGKEASAAGAATEETSNNGANDDEAAEYMYELSGVTVHTGSQEHMHGHSTFHVACWLRCLYLRVADPCVCPVLLLSVVQPSIVVIITPTSNLLRIRRRGWNSTTQWSVRLIRV
jgi:hypothetical protein